SIQVSKTFTPDQQGDASGGAVNIILKGIPDETTLQFNSQIGFNSQAVGNNNFLTYNGGGLDYWGGSHRQCMPDPIPTRWTDAVGAQTGTAQPNSKWSIAGGGKYELTDDITIGGYADFFYENESAFFNNGINDSYWVVTPGGPMVPQTTQGLPSQGDFKTKL